MNLTKRLIQTMSLPLVAALAIGTTLPAAADTFQDEKSGLYFETLSAAKECSVVTSDTYAFEKSDVVIPSTVTYNKVKYTVTKIGDNAFANQNIYNITIPEGVTTIGKKAFSYCKLQAISLPKSISYIDEDAFHESGSYTKVEIKDLEAWCKITFINAASNPLKSAKHLYLNGKEITSVSIPKSLTAVNNYTFFNAQYLTSVTIPKSVTSIGNSAFASCVALPAITIPESVTSIGNSAFENCISLTSIAIPKSVTSVGNFAFYRCTAMTSASIPEGIKTIGDFAFEYCSALESIDLPDSLQSFGMCCFAYCTSLKTAQFGTGLSAISYSAFLGCSSLIGVTTTQFIGEEQNVLILPDNIQTISASAFQDCPSLEHVWIGDGCKRVLTKAFYGDTGLITISSRNELAPDLRSKDSFSDETYETATLYIRDGEDVWNSYIDETYNYWYLFLSREREGEGGIQVGVDEVTTDGISVTSNGMTIEISGNEGEVSIYTLSGVKVYQGSDNRIELRNPDIYVVIVNDKCYKIALK